MKQKSDPPVLRNPRQYTSQRRFGGRIAGGRTGRHTRLEALEARQLLSVSPPNVSNAWADVAPAQEIRLPFFVPPQAHLRNVAGNLLTDPAAGDPLQIATAYLRSNAPLLGLSQRDIDIATMTDRYTDSRGGVTHIYFAQALDGLSVANATMNVNVTADGRIINVGSSFVAGLGDRAGSLREPAISPLQAVLAAGAALGLQGKVQPKTPAEGAAFSAGPVFDAPGHSLDPIAPRQMFVPRPDGSVALAWNLRLRTPDNQHWYDTAVDASTGELLMAADWADPASYNVLPTPSESPADLGRVIVNDPHDPAASPFGWHDTNGADGAEFTDTRGNNVSAQEDADDNNSGGFRPNGGANLVFDFPFDTGQQPSAYREASITNLFYWNNILHDVHYKYGFDEISGNFQVNNYGQGGLGGDAVQADAQDGSGTNNANMSTPPDGQQPRMQQFLFTISSPSRDSSFSNDIIAHEYGHGVSNRLTGGPANSNALDALQSGGMGEGWSDWWSLMFTQDPGDTKFAAYPVGTYVLNQPEDGPGIRRFPYSFDMSIDPLTLGVFNQSPAVHDAGEIWCSVLWDMNWLLIDKYGYEPNLAAGYQGPGSAGNLLALQLVMDGLKLQPASPTFLDARDAILLADEVLTGGANEREIWTAFARRGFGLSADVDDGSGANSLTVVEAFDLPIFDLRVTLTSPFVGGIETEPVNEFRVDFSQEFVPATVNAGDFRVNGIPANRVSILDADSLSFTYNVSPVTAQGTQVMTMAAGALTSAVDGKDSVPFEGAFFFDTLRMSVVSIEPAEGSSVELPFTSVVVHFNEAIDPASVAAGDLRLNQGSVGGVEILDADSLRFQLSDITHEGTLNLVFEEGVLLDNFGNPSKPHTGALQMDFGVVPFPGAFAPVSPLGSLAYAATATGIIGTSGDMDTFTLKIEAGQLLAVQAFSAAGWQPRVVVRNAQGDVVASGGGGAASQTLLLPAVEIVQAGVFTLEVSAPDGSTGEFTLQPLLNATHEAEEQSGATNDSLATAQLLQEAFTSPNGVAERALVIGKADAAGNAMVEREPNATNTTATVLNGNFLAPAGDLYQLEIDAAQGDSADTDWFGLGTLEAGDVLTITLSGVGSDRGTLDDPLLFVYVRTAVGETFLTSDDDAGPGTDSRIYRYTLPTTGAYFIEAQDFVFASTGSYDLTVLLENQGPAPATTDATSAESEPNNSIATAHDVSASWRKVVRQSTTSGNIARSDDVDYYRAELKAGDLLTVDVQSALGWQPSVELYGSRGLAVAVDRGDDFTGRASVYAFRVVVGGSYYMRVGAAFGTGDYELNLFVSSENPPVLAVAAADYYSIELAAGQSLSLAIDATNPQPIALELHDAAGNLLASGLSGVSADQSINDFRAPSDGTYYAVVSASRGPSYRLLAARDATIELERNDRPASAQFVESRAVDGVQHVLGRFNPSQPEVTTFSELPLPSVDDLRFNHVTFDFKVGGVDSPDAVFGRGGPGVTKYSDGIGLEGDASGILTFEFEVPTASLRFSALLSVGGTVPNGVIVDLYDAAGSLITVIPLELRDQGFFYAEALFEYSGAEVARAVLNFNESVAFRFFLDDLTYELGTRFDLYSVTVAELGTLILETQTPGDADGAPFNDVNPQLRLLDSAGNVLAADDDSAADGRNARIAYAIPRGVHTLYVEVGASTTEPNSEGDYLLRIGSPILIPAPFQVSSISPSDGTRLRLAPSTVDVRFNGGVQLSSLQAGDLRIDGAPAVAVEFLDGAAARFTLPGGLSDGMHELTMSDGALIDLQGTPLTAFASRFVLDTIAPRVTASRLSPGDVVAAGNVSFVFAFGEPMRVDQDVLDDILLFGQVGQEFLSPAAGNWNAAGTILTVSFIGVPEDSFQLTLLARDGGFEDLVGINLDGETFGLPIPPNRSGNGVEGGDFVVSFSTDVETGPFVVPLQAVGPTGTLAYRGVTTGILGVAGDNDSFVMALDAGQTLTLTALGATLRTSITLYDPAGNALGTAIASALGGEAVLRLAPVAAVGTYRILVHDAATAVGAYRITALVNADLELEQHGGLPNNSRAAAQDVTPAFVELGVAGGLEIANVVGRMNRPAGYLPSEEEPNNDQATANSASAAFAEVAQLYQFSVAGSLSGLRTGADWYSLGALSEGDTLTLSLAGAGSNRGTLAGVFLELYAGPAASPYLVASDIFGSGSGGDGLIHRLAIFGSDAYYVRVAGDGLNYGTYELTAWLENGGRSPRTDGGISVESEPNNTAATANVSSNAWREVGYLAATTGAASASDVDQFAYDFQAGDLVTSIVNGRGAADTTLVWRDANGALLGYDDGASSDVPQNSYLYGLRIPATGRYTLEARSFTTGDYTANVYLSSPVAPPLPTLTDDYYRVELAQGERLSLAVKALRGAESALSVENSAGDTLFTASLTTENLGTVIPEFVAPAAGTYYIAVRGLSGEEYALSAVRGAGFDLEANNALATAQPLPASGRALGGVSVANATRLFATTVDGSNQIVELDPRTGAVLNRFASPDGVLNGLDGLAYNGKSLFFVNAYGTNQLYELNPDNGAVLDVDPVFGVAVYFDALAALNGKLYIANYSLGEIYEFDPDSDQVTKTLSLPALGPMSGLAGASDPDRLVATFSLNSIVAEVDPLTGNVTSAFVAAGVYGGVALVGNEVYLGAFAGATPQIDVYARDGSFLRSIVVPHFVGALGGDADTALDEDWYRVELAAGKVLAVSTRTPGDRAGEFVNTLDPMLELYDSSGLLVAANGNSLPDRRNATLYFSSPDGGVFYVRLSAAAARGEYILDVRQLDVPAAGDTDFDGDVDADDLNNVRNGFGGGGVGDTFPFDGDIDLDDLNAVRNNFDNGVPPAPTLAGGGSSVERSASVDAVFGRASGRITAKATDELFGLVGLDATLLETPSLRPTGRRFARGRAAR